MNKLKNFFDQMNTERRDTRNNKEELDLTSFDIQHVDLTETLVLTKEEEKEIIKEMALPDNVKVTEIITETLKRFKDPDSEEGLAFGTVRIKTDKGEAMGTVRVKEGESYGTIRYLGTVKVNNSTGKEYIDSGGNAPDWADFGSVRITREAEDFGTVKCTGTRQDIAFIYRPPEPWEISILSLEKGEYNPDMKEEAFGKYKKKRKGLNSDLGWGNESSDGSTEPSNVSLSGSTSSLSPRPNPKSSRKKEKTSNLDFNQLQENLTNIEKSNSDKSVKSVDRNLSRKKSSSNMKPPTRISSLSRNETTPEKETIIEKPPEKEKERAWAKYRKENTKDFS